MTRIPLRSLLVVVAGIGVGALATPAAAAPCAGFTDVEDTSAFCVNVEWLKNREITLGCTSATLYCPGETVIRLSMAAFLNRLANALTPAAVGGILSSLGFDLDASPVACQQAQFAVTGFPRLAHGHAVVAVGSASQALQVGVTFVESTDNGVTYTPVSPTQAVDTAPNTFSTVAVILPPRTLQVGASYRYGVRLTRLAGAAVPGTDTNGTCEIKVFFENRNGTSSPLDEAP